MPPLEVTVAFIVAGAVALLLLVALIRTALRARAQRKRIHRIDLADEEVARLRVACDALVAKRATAEADVERATDELQKCKSALHAEYEAAWKNIQRRVSDLQTSYAEAKATYIAWSLRSGSPKRTLTGDVRVGFEVIAITLAWPSTPPRRHVQPAA